jgi:hypothetical protein
MAATNRETARDALAALLQSALVGSGKPAQAVYGYKVSDFQGQSPVVMVMSGGSGREELTYDVDWDNIFFLVIKVFVLYADPAAGWTEAMAEDRLDLIEKTIADTLSANYSHSGGAWERIGYDGRSQVIEVVSEAGDPYVVEIIPIRAEKDDT